MTDIHTIMNPQKLSQKFPWETAPFPFPESFSKIHGKYQCHAIWPHGLRGFKNTMFIDFLNVKKLLKKTDTQKFPKKPGWTFPEIHIETSASERSGCQMSTMSTIRVSDPSCQAWQRGGNTRQVEFSEDLEGYTWNSKQPVLYGCFNWMIPNLYIKNGWKSPNINFLNGWPWGSRYKL